MPEPFTCLPLDGNLGTYKTPKGFFTWHASIWKPKVDPRNFGPKIFHPDVLLTDPFATMRGPKASARYFQLLFGFFPKLTGPHHSFAANESEIFVQWAFRTTGGRRVQDVPATDLFCFKDGLIHYRLATFDVSWLARALLAAYGGRMPDLDMNIEEVLWRWHVDDDFAEESLLSLRAEADVPL